jgi:outer membrane protein TolC
MATQYAADVRHLTLDEAVRLAISQNRELKIARLKVIESEQKKAGEYSGYFPLLTNQSNALQVSALQIIEVPPGAFGAIGGTLIPPQGVTVGQGQLTFFSSGTQLSQPLTQLIRIHDTNRIAAAEVAISRDGLKKAENQVALDVHTVYFAILIARFQKQSAEQQSSYATDNLRESEDQVRNGSALKIAAIQGRANLLESQQAVLTADLQLADLMTELNDLLGLPLDTRLELAPAAPANFDQRPRVEYVQSAWPENPQILAAETTVRKARAALGVAKSAYIPDITAYARHSYQDGVPFLVRNFGTFGLTLSWDVFDFGKCRSAVREREVELDEAEENLRQLKDEVAVGIERSYNKLERTRRLVEVASQVVRLRQDGERLSQNQLALGVNIGVGSKTGHRDQLPSPSGLSAGQPRLLSCLGGTRTSDRAYPGTSLMYACRRSLAG